MKRLLVFALCAVLMATLALPVFADVIWLPSQSESPFFWNHQDECELEQKRYYANSPEGEVALRKAPDGKVKARVWTTARCSMFPTPIRTGAWWTIPKATAPICGSRWRI